MNKKRYICLIFLCNYLSCSTQSLYEKDINDEKSFEIIDIMPFDDHTVPSFSTVKAFFEYAGQGKYPVQVKFLITNFLENHKGEVHYEEPDFYYMHDEWSWFVLLNGHEIPGYDFKPVNGLSFLTVKEIKEWAQKQPTLPLDLTFLPDGRLYSKHFYDKSFGDNRFFGLGSLLYYPPKQGRKIPEEIWAFELEYVDVPTEKILVMFFSYLTQTLPPEIGEVLKWLVRSTEQMKIATKMKTDGNPYGERWITYEDLVVPGEVMVYNPGICAGVPLRILEGNPQCFLINKKNIVVLERVLDDIPPVAGIITSVPQTPLAHIALLAQARGTPNLYIGDAINNQMFKTWEYYQQKVILKASSNNSFKLAEITESEFAIYEKKFSSPAVHIKQIDFEDAPETFDLTSAGFSDMHGLIPLIGGKAGGFLALHDGKEIEIPPAPIALTIKGYVRHLNSLDPKISDILQQADFRDNRMVRFLVLMGQEAFEERFAGCPDSIDFLNKFWAVHKYTVLGKTVQKGGIRGMITQAKIDESYLEMILKTLKERFAFLSHFQALRFRSSSTVEDIEGFNGAGLYESYSGFLYPEEQSSPKDKTKSVESAIKKVWASYWLFDAFEERENAGIDHLSGNMGIVVHPSFEDSLEEANGVVTLQFARNPEGILSRMTVNIQKGALSVTNPPPGSNALPEVDIVTKNPTSTPKIERVRPSSEVQSGMWLLSDQELAEMHEKISMLAEKWLDTRNNHYPIPQRNSSLVLDLEIKKVKEGWPIMANGEKKPPRLVYKQVRQLDDPINFPAEIINLPVPKDILGKTILVEERFCTNPVFSLNTVEFYTNPLKTWAFDYSVSPFNAYVGFYFKSAIPQLSIPAGKAFAIMHTEAEKIEHPGMKDGNGWSLEIVIKDKAKTDFTYLSIDQSGAWTIIGKEMVSGTNTFCQTSTKSESKEAYLEKLLKQKM